MNPNNWVSIPQECDGTWSVALTGRPPQVKFASEDEAKKKASEFVDAMLKDK